MNLDFTDEQILAEVQRIKYLYKMKGVFRYDRERDPWQRAESNAEHLYGMMTLVSYFLPLEDPNRFMDRQRIFDLILVHDIDEIESGDIISYKKTDADREREKESMKTALDNMPQHMAYNARDLAQEYEKQETAEARFTKAIDKLEPAFELFDKYGKRVLEVNKTTYEQNIGVRSGYVDCYLHMKRFSDVIANEMRRQGYFYEEGN